MARGTAQRHKEISVYSFDVSLGRHLNANSACNGMDRFPVALWFVGRN